MTNDALRVLAWANSRPHPVGFKVAFLEIESLSDDIGYLDRMVKKLTGDTSCPCEAAARLVDPGFRVGTEHDGHWVLEPSGLASRAGETWNAAIAAFKAKTQLEATCPT